LGEAVHRFDKAVRRQVGTNGSAIAVSLGETDSRAYRESQSKLIRTSKDIVIKQIPNRNQDGTTAEK
jgi:hypothetical protein